VESDISDPMETFEPWLLRRVAQAVEAGEVPASLLTELQTEIQAARGRPQAEGHAAAILQIADLADVDQKKAAEVPASIEAQPTVTRELLMRRTAGAWLEGAAGGVPESAKTRFLSSRMHVGSCEFFLGTGGGGSKHACHWSMDWGTGSSEAATLGTIPSGMGGSSRPVRPGKRGRSATVEDRAPQNGISRCCSVASGSKSMRAGGI